MEGFHLFKPFTDVVAAFHHNIRRTSARTTDPESPGGVQCPLGDRPSCTSRVSSQFRISRFIRSFGLKRFVPVGPGQQQKRTGWFCSGGMSLRFQPAACHWSVPENHQREDLLFS